MVDSLRVRGLAAHKVFRETTRQFSATRIDEWELRIILLEIVYSNRGAISMPFEVCEKAAKETDLKHSGSAGFIFYTSKHLFKTISIQEICSLLILYLPVPFSAFPRAQWTAATLNLDEQISSKARKTQKT
jgi:hypothetical protein